MSLGACASWQDSQNISAEEKTRTYLSQQWSPIKPATIELWTDSSLTHRGFPKRIILYLDPESIAQHGFQDMDSFRLFFREHITEWLESIQHPEALCTSVNLLDHNEYLKLEIEIVCR